jgi:hypothetical protein
MSAGISGYGIVHPVVDGHVVYSHLKRAVTASDRPQCSSDIVRCCSSVFGEQCGPTIETATRAAGHACSVVVEQVEADSGAIGEYGAEALVFRECDLCRSLWRSISVEYPPVVSGAVA